jgi:hypothetical protein
MFLEFNQCLSGCSFWYWTYELSNFLGLEFIFSVLIFFQYFCQLHYVVLDNAICVIKIRYYAKFTQALMTKANRRKAHAFGTMKNAGICLDERCRTLEFTYGKNNFQSTLEFITHFAFWCKKIGNYHTFFYKFFSGNLFYLPFLLCPRLILTPLIYRGKYPINKETVERNLFKKKLKNVAKYKGRFTN